ncbi:MAG: hypothetical protein ACF8XB_12245 [Planctomycetota bacterium JB042]
MKRVVLASVLLASVPSASAADFLDLFGMTYEVRRFDLTAEVTGMPNPLNPPQLLDLLEVEGAHYLGNDRLLLSTNHMAKFYGDGVTYSNWVVEVSIDRNAAGAITGLSFVRIAALNDMNLTPAPNDFDLDPGGLTINTGSVGIGANGGLVVANTETEELNAYDISGATPTQTTTGGFGIDPPNDGLEDIVYHDGVFYTIHEDITFNGLSIEKFGPTGTHLGFFPIAGAVDAHQQGAPKGLTLLADVDTFPRAFQGEGGVLLVTLDDNHPGLQAFDLDGNLVGYEPLTVNDVPFGAPLLDPGLVLGAPHVLQLESCASLPEDGTIVLVQQGSDNEANHIYFLVPTTRNYGDSCVGSNGQAAELVVTGALVANETVTFDLGGGLPFAHGLILTSGGADSLLAGSCPLNLALPLLPLTIPLQLDANGEQLAGILVPPTPAIPAGFALHFQAFFADASTPDGFVGTQGAKVAAPK